MESEEEIVITGISGRFPECNNIEEFREALMNGTDLITEDDRRFPMAWAKLNGFPIASGKIPVLDKFDASFFGMNTKWAEYSDPRHRILLELTYEAIIDAGFNPVELKGSNTGVYAAISSVSNQQVITPNSDGYGTMGLRSSNAANSISFCFNFNGTSYSADTACSSSLQLLSQAFHDIKEGRVDNAIVCGSNIIMDAAETQELDKLNFLGANGRCKTFNKVRQGFVRSESANALLLQRRSKSRRIYATIIGSQVNCDGWKEEGITYPSSVMQLKLMKDVQSRSNISPNDVTYVELHGTGTKAGDIQECRTIVNMYCQNRKTPLLVGSVKSNMGHAESTAGLCAITKVILAIQSEIIPPNIHSDPIDQELDGIKDKKLKVVSEKMPLTEGLLAINSFGFEGTNGHCVLKPHEKKKLNSSCKPPNRLVQVSGRTEEAVNYFLDEIEKNQDDPEFLSLLDEIHKSNIDGHSYRGYAVLGENPIREIVKYNQEKRPLWFIFSGVGSQWFPMGRELMNIKVFRNTFARCAAALLPHGLDLDQIIMNGSEEDIERNEVIFTGVSSISIALIDLLWHLGIQPDFFAGHSLGEIACAYLNGDITVEQATLLSYARGYACNNTKAIPGQMAAIGMSAEEISKILPDDIFVGCENNRSTVTISGPKESTMKFVNELTAKGVFALFVSSANLPLHTKYMAEGAKLLHEFCGKVLTNPKRRSSKWISSSVPPEKMQEEWAQYNCADYHVNNFSNRVLFSQVLDRIDENAIVVEIAPTGLLQSIIKRSVGTNVTLFPIMNKTSKNQEQFLLAAIGKIYNAGGQPQLRKLYEGVSFPVSRGTKMISPMIKWDHSISWYVPYWKHQDAYGEVVTVNLSNSRWAYLKGHNIDGRILMPASGYLEMVWIVRAKMSLKEISDFPVVMENIKFIRATVLPENENVNFLINITKEGHFEIFEGGSLSVTGKIRTTKDISKEFKMEKTETHLNHGGLKMSHEDFYKELRLRRCCYKDTFQAVSECDLTATHGKIKWTGLYTTFVDNMLQTTILDHFDRELRLPAEITKLTLDPHTHLKEVENEYIEFTRNIKCPIIRTKGIEIFNSRFSTAPRRQNTEANPLLETYEFVPYNSISNTNLNIDLSLKIALDIVVQNTPFIRKDLILGDLTEGDDDILVHSKIKSIIQDQITADIEYKKILLQDCNTQCDLVILSNTVIENINIQQLKKCLKYESFIMAIGKISTYPKELELIFESPDLTLFRSNCDFPQDFGVINILNSNFDWLDKVKEQVRNAKNQVVYLFNQTERTSGIVGLVKCLLAECKDIVFKGVFIDQNAELFSVEKEMYRKQLSKKLTINIYRNNQWGTYVHLPLRDIEMKYTDNASVSINTLGDLSTLTWSERAICYIREGETSEIVNVHCTALNFRDVMVATGKIQSLKALAPTDAPVSLGLDYSGITQSGRRVMGMVLREGLTLQTKTLPGYTFDVPDSWSLEEAATVPTVYLTCYYALIMRGQMEAGESILIHAGTGGVGIAAISIALSLKATVFTTVSSQEKKDFLINLYPQLKEENIGYSRDTTFEKLILEKTNGEGVDLILNSLAGDLLQSSLRCIGRCGRFLEIGKVDFLNGTLLNSHIFLKDCSFHGIVLEVDTLLRTKLRNRLTKLFREGVANGVVKPLPLHVFNHVEMEIAFRFLASGKHKGKVVIKIRNDEKEKVPKILAYPKIFFDPRHVYIIIGGLGGLGLELTQWMISRGARKIILNTRRDVWNGYQANCLRKWSQYEEIVVKINLNDTTTVQGSEKIIEESQKLGPVAGIFQLGIVLREGFIIDQTADNFKQVFKPKIISSQNLDKIARTKCPGLKYFVVFSTAACGRGNLRQTNYGMANSALEMLCEQRRRDNLPALAVQYGPVKDVGVLAEKSQTDKQFFFLGYQEANSCIDALEKFLLTNTRIGSSLILLKDQQSTENTVAAKNPPDIVAHILGLKNVDSIDKTKTLSRLGLDSIMTTEIQQTLYRNFLLDLQQEQIRNLTFEYLFELNKEKKSSEK